MSSLRKSTELWAMLIKFVLQFLFIVFFGVEPVSKRMSLKQRQFISLATSSKYNKNEERLEVKGSNDFYINSDRTA